MWFSACLQRRVIRFFSKDIHMFSRVACSVDLSSGVALSAKKQNSDTEYRCNICELVITASDKSQDLLDHIKLNHKEVFDLHKDNPDNSVGFRIEFLHFNVVKNENEIDSQTRDVIIGEVCEATTEEEVPKSLTIGSEADIVSDVGNQVVVTKKKKHIKTICLENRKRSWVWKYFEKVSSFMYRCTFCNAILSIKGCNTNNLNRHMRTKHPRTFRLEMEHGRKDDADIALDLEASLIKENSLLDKSGISDAYITTEGVVTESTQKQRSWVWMYFTRLSNTLAQCKLCDRTICHGGNATGNMNRHLKMRHNKTGDMDHSWIWKVFEVNDEDLYTCKICQFQCVRLDDLDKNINAILNHLRIEHGVISGDQIITSSL